MDRSPITILRFCLMRLPDVVFAYEVGGFSDAGAAGDGARGAKGAGAKGAGAEGAPRLAGCGPVAARSQEFVDPPREHVGGDAARERPGVREVSASWLRDAGSAAMPRRPRRREATATGVVSYASRLILSRCLGEMLSDVMLPPQPPQPSVIAGSSPVVSPIDPWVVGVLTTMRPAGFFRPNSRMI